MALTSFADVQSFFNDFITTNGIDIAGAAHGAFWNTTYKNFVTGTVPNETDSNGNPIPILTKGNGAQSNIVQALAGTGMWDPGTGGSSRGCRGEDLISPTLRFRNSRTGSPQAAPNSGS
jgi:hypothetical protein